MKNLFKKIAILSIAMVVFGCSKDGATGATGNANVQSATVNTTASDWSYVSSANIWRCSYPTPLITSSVVNSGLVHAYIFSSST